MKAYIDDLMLLFGIGLVFTGVYMHTKWLAFVVAGSIIIALWVLSALVRYRALSGTVPETEQPRPQAGTE